MTTTTWEPGMARKDKAGNYILYCPPECANGTWGTCPECFARSQGGLGCNHGPVCDDCLKGQPGDAFACPYCGADEDEEGETNWEACYFQPAVQSVEVTVDERGEPVEEDFLGDEQIVGDATESDTLRCRVCAHEITLSVVRWHAPAAGPAVDHATEMRAHIIRWTNVYHHTHERDSGREMDFTECEAAGCVAAAALLAKIDTTKEAA